MTQANKKQVGGSHYRSHIQHWDYVWANDLDYFQGQITKYIARWKSKGGIDDLRKAQHFLEKYIELNLPAVATKDEDLPVNGGWTRCGNDGYCDTCGMKFEVNTFLEGNKAFADHKKLCPGERIYEEPTRAYVDQG